MWNRTRGAFRSEQLLAVGLYRLLVQILLSTLNTFSASDWLLAIMTKFSFRDTDSCVWEFAVAIVAGVVFASIGQWDNGWYVDAVEIVRTKGLFRK